MLMRDPDLLSFYNVNTNTPFSYLVEGFGVLYVPSPCFKENSLLDSVPRRNGLTISTLVAIRITAR